VEIVYEWTGRHTRALRLALRMSVRAFAEYLGVAARTVTKWEHLGGLTRPRPDMQAALDTALGRCDDGARRRFEHNLGDVRSLPGMSVGAVATTAHDLESWSDDLDRASAALNTQSFTFAGHLLDRWLCRFDPTRLGDAALHLYGRGSALRGDVLRDQGAIAGPLSAGHAYGRARSIFQQLDVPRRVAQLDLSMAVIDEMSGRLSAAARRYQDLADDERLGQRDRARALLWVGTAVDKAGDHDHASRVMTIASRRFDDLTEPEDWSVAQQKLALAHRGAKRLDTALKFIGLARSSATTPSPLQRVRLDTAYGHILLSDQGTRREGQLVLDRSAALATTYGMSHQLRSIEGIRRNGGRAPKGDQGDDA
jgi:hypothetical protein